MSKFKVGDIVDMGREMSRGHWSLNASLFDGTEVDDSSREHIAQLVTEGYTSGELIQEPSYPEDEDDV